MENNREKINWTKPSPKITFTEKLRRNPWMGSTFVLGLAIIVLLGFSVINDFKLNNITSINNQTNISNEINMLTPQEVCPQIRAVPSWIRNNEIVEGYTEFNNETPYNIVDNLIKNKVYFVWSSTCIVCARQKELFGDEWQKYVESGYTIQCR